MKYSSQGEWSWKFSSDIAKNEYFYTVDAILTVLLYEYFFTPQNVTVVWQSAYVKWQIFFETLFYIPPWCQMKLCTVIVLLNTYQNTKRNFQNYDLWHHNDVIAKNNGKIQTSVKPDKLYINRKVMMRAFRKCNFIAIESLNQKLWLFK